jgi:hypothetical protein
MPSSCHFLLLCLAIRHSKNKKHARIKHSRYRKDFFKVFLSRSGVAGIGKSLDVL